MEKLQLHTPVTFIFFNRPDTTIQVFEEIRKAQPQKLYLVADGPREGNSSDLEKNTKIKEWLETHIDWDCKVTKLYAEHNLGCKNRIATGISAVLEQETETIILEDDVIPCPEFFRFCQEMLTYYCDNPRVMMVSGTNLMKKYAMTKPYTFSCFSSIWGWATWRRAWQLYDPDVRDWPEMKKNHSFRCVQSGLAYLFLKRNIESVYTKKKDTWDIQWDYCRHKNKGLGIVPRENLIRNIGFDREDATHTKEGSTEDFSYGQMHFPIEKGNVVKRDTEYDKAYIHKYFGMKKILDYVRKKLSK
ncbi:MAG TPA: hypothetical protein PLZ77_00250 [Lachnospiraceae bacterium]|nr:hypothetical protein [Lachnospiraceae bacterium]HPF28515.1 hypothetical protein [Lachnospiraceae bacterium]